ncbi:helix-turn-helix domain-containing protein [Stappia sp. GBMRC 2046]|uniref:Helix-turn-helix domain-containing protein n=1 Tax=Stappia sediminis TaxID=2692190 RepID=A0A7X3S6D7_9HYPH|nr:helix-turn-helix domain-containing protein [Stappia sediminis]MXN63871.1 helix-turn-helix domain-containing protein [Stappia sediminis]
MAKAFFPKIPPNDKPPAADAPVYLTVRETADYLRVSKSFLDKARVAGNGPPFVRFGNRVLYRRDDVDAWATGRRFSSTSEYEIEDAADKPRR